MEQEFLMRDLLNACLEKDNAQRKSAERKLKELRETYPQDFVLEAANELISEDRSEYTRELAGLMFQSIVKPAKTGDKKSPWDTLSRQKRLQVREGIMKALATQNSNVRAGASSAIAAIACKELEKDHEGWDDLIPTLESALEHKNPAYKLSSIQTVAKICEDVRPSYINAEDAKSLFTTLMQQLEASDLKLQCQILEALLVMIPFASHKLSLNEEFAMSLTNLIFDFVEQGVKQDIQILERAWKCMTELAHNFYLSFYDKVAIVLDAAFNLTKITPGCSQREMDLFERCAMLGMETVSILIKEEHERMKRKKNDFNIVFEMSEPLADELLKALKLFNQVAFGVDHLCEEIFESVFPAAELALENLVKLVTEKNSDKGMKIINRIKATFVEALDDTETKAAGIAMVACCFAAKDNEQTKDVLEKGFGGFLDFLRSDNPFVIERMVKLFDNAFEKHYTLLLLDPNYCKPLVNMCYRFKESPVTAVYLLKILQRFSETAVKMRVCIQDVSLGLVEEMFHLMVKPEVSPKEIELQVAACQTLTKTITSMQNSINERKALKSEVIPNLCDSLFSSMEHLDSLSKSQYMIQDWLMESVAQALLVTQKVSEDQFNKLFHLVICIFNHREEVTGQGLLLFNSLLHGSISENTEQVIIPDEEVIQSVGTMAPFIEHAMRNNYGSKVAMDAMICASTVAMRLRYESHKFYETLMTPLDEIIADMNPRDHNHMYVALSAYSDFALYTQALFKPFADNYLKTLNFVGTQIIDYWKEKEQEGDGGLQFYEFDEDDRMCLNLTEALIDAYHNTVMAAEQGKWRSKLSSTAVDILTFYVQAVSKMGSMMSPSTKADLGLAFADFLRSLKDIVFNWFSQNLQFMKDFYKHLKHLHQQLMHDAQQGKGPRDEDLFDQLQTSHQVMSEWFGKMNLPLI